MSILFVSIVAGSVSCLTLFSGFGLGTLLMPAFALFFPVEVAVAATAIVHAANNVFKVGLLYRDAVPRIVVRFGLPAILGALVGAALLTQLAGQSALAVWTLAGRQVPVTPVKLVMGGLILGFAVFHALPASERLAFAPRWLPLGGVVSGFFGGLSGHQGALRAAFLVPLGLTPAAFASTQAVLATLVDAARLVVYGSAYQAGRMRGVETAEQWTLVVAAMLSAFAGAWIGRRLLGGATWGAVRWITVGLLILVGAGLSVGLL